jgi:hypothetical protein
MSFLQHNKRESAIRLRTAGFQVEAVGPAADQLATVVAVLLLAFCMCHCINQLVRN